MSSSINAHCWLLDIVRYLLFCWRKTPKNIKRQRLFEFANFQEAIHNLIIKELLNSNTPKIAWGLTTNADVTYVKIGPVLPGNLKHKCEVVALQRNTEIGQQYWKLGKLWILTICPWSEWLWQATFNKWGVATLQKILDPSANFSWWTMMMKISNSKY